MAAVWPWCALTLLKYRNLVFVSALSLITSDTKISNVLILTDATEHLDPYSQITRPRKAKP